MPRSLTRTCVDARPRPRCGPGSARPRGSRPRGAGRGRSSARAPRCVAPPRRAISRPSSSRDSAVAVDARRVVAGEGERHRRQRGDGAGDADQRRAAVAENGTAADGCVDRASAIAAELVGRGAGRGESKRFRQPNGSERQAGSKADAAVGRRARSRSSRRRCRRPTSRPARDVRERRDDRAETSAPLRAAPSMTWTGVPRISAAGSRKRRRWRARRSASVPMAAMRRVVAARDGRRSRAARPACGRCLRHRARRRCRCRGRAG